MDDVSLSIAAISARKQQEITENADVVVFKRQLNQEAEIANQLIQSATETVPAPGVGTRLNVVA